MENFQNRFIGVLGLPLPNKISELTFIIQRCGQKELQDIFPALVSSIFGELSGLGWNLRLITREQNMTEFEWLYSFLNPMGGAMFEMCYKLLSEAKFDVPLSSLPVNMRQMLESGRYSLYYSDLIRVNPFSRQITHISLNAFDYYMLHFAIYGTINLHKSFPSIAQVHADKLTSVYFSLTAEYITCFLPANPDSVVFPPNIGGTIKVSPPMQINNATLPARAPVYIKLSALNRHLPNLSNPRVVEATPRNNAWRTESVLYLFIDIWLRNNFDQTIDMPSIEFMQLVRVLVKQVHAFGNAADIDNTLMAELRKLAQPMMSTQMFTFLKGLISRWALDGSFQAVQELWLSHIQPWRYTHDRDYGFPGRVSDIVIFPKFESFIQENIRDYTQIFVHLMPRYEQLDLSSIRDVMLVYRLIKVFGQPRLVDILRRCEREFVMSLSPKKVFKSSPVHKTNAMDLSYEPLFDSPRMEQTIQRLMRRVKIAEYLATKERIKIEEEEKRNSTGFWNNVKLLFAMADGVAESKVLKDKKRMPEVLNFILNTAGALFDINPLDISIDDYIEHTKKEESLMFMSASMSSLHNSSNMLSFNGSIPSPALIRSRYPVYKGDPALLPIRSNEVTFLVRFLYQVCHQINTMYSHELKHLWERQDILGKLSRPLMEAPMTAETFERYSGYVNLRYDQLGPRIYLRPLASYGTILLIFLSIVLGYILFNRPSFGFFLLLVCALVKCYIVAAFRNVRREVET